jgi:hypothetical protein
MTQPFNRGEEAERASLADVAAWEARQARQPRRMPRWLIWATIGVLALSWIVIVMAAREVWRWVG